MSGCPEISVVVPIYQSAWSIARTIRSVLNQRFEEFELILVDDGSTDDLDGQMRQYLGDPRIRIVRQANQGLAAARNRGFREARAPLVAPIDADDMWHPDFLGACKAALDSQPSAPFAFAYSLRMDENDFVVSLGKPEVPPRHDLVGLLRQNSVGNGSAVLFRRDAVLALGGYDEEMGRRGLHGAEDYKLVLSLARIAEPALVPRLLVAYRRVPSGMSLSDPDRQLRACLAVIENVREGAPEVPSAVYRDARTSIIAWLLPQFIAHRRWREAAGLFARSYLANPLWVLHPPVLRGHLASVARAVTGIAARITGTVPKRRHLSQVWLADDRPFKFLASDFRGTGSATRRKGR